jgi:hypothetical protein
MTGVPPAGASRLQVEVARVRLRRIAPPPNPIAAARLHTVQLSVFPISTHTSRLERGWISHILAPRQLYVVGTTKRRKPPANSLDQVGLGFVTLACGFP